MTKDTYRHKFLSIYEPLTFLLLYLSIHFFIRIFLNDTLQVDDREQIFHAQELLLGYSMPQPPAYSWLSYFFFKITGPNLFSLTLLKYILIYATFFYIWLSTKEMFGVQGRKYLLYSFLLMPSFAWHMHQGFTHTILLGLGISMTFFHTIKIINDKSLLNFLMLGISIAVGFYGKYSFIFFLIFLSTACLTLKNFRQIITNRRIFITIVTAIVLLSPHIIWLTQNLMDISRMANNRLNLSSEIFNPHYLKTLTNTLSSFLGFITPLIFLFFSLYWFSKKNLKEKIDSPYKSLLDRFYLLIFMGLLIVPIFFNYPEVKVRWLHPFLMLFPFWLVFLLQQNINLKNNFKIFIFVVILFSLAIVFIRLVQYTIAPNFGYYGRVNVPIIKSLENIPKSDLRNIKIIKTDDYFLGPHLFSKFKDAQIVILGKNFNGHLSNENINNKCLLIWDNDGYDDKIPSISKNKEVQTITKRVNEFEYRLSYAITDAKDCI